MTDLGLVNSNGKPLSITGFSVMLNNALYMGLIRMKGEMFSGIHEPLITTSVFNRVQSILKGKANTKGWRRTLICTTCGRSLIGEIQKGHVYCRCQTKGC